jgi:trk system potassium uptake protein TrkA
LVAQHLLDITLIPEASDVTTLRGGQQIVELKLNGDSPLVGLTPADIRSQGLLDESLSMVARVRGDSTHIIPVDEPLAAGDGLIVFATERLRGRRRRIFRESTQGD